jgi:RimJ/RimL family protein N-acetyltransferase
MGVSKTIEHTHKVMGHAIHSKDSPDYDKLKYGFLYIVHKRIFEKEDESHTTEQHAGERTEVIGILSMRRLQSLPLPENLSVADGPETGILKVEAGYLFLPTAWGQGYAAEALAASMASIKKNPQYWAPYEKVYVEAITSPGNPQSQRVLDKAGFQKMGVHEWDGEKVFLGGEWRDPIVLVYGVWVVGTA